MAGKRQHFVPLSLQRGFASHVAGEQAFTWVHRKGAEPFNTNVKNVGVERFFYSVELGTELDADPAITKFEQEFSPLIADLRAGESSAFASAERIAKLLAHFEVRTRHVRQSFLTAGTHLSAELMKFVSDEGAFGRHFRRAVDRDPSLMKDAMAKELEKRGIPRELLPQIMEMSKPLLEQMMPGTLHQMSMFARQFRASLPSLLNEAVKSGHIKALMQTRAPEKKVNYFSGLQFRVAYCETAIPLGDSVVLFHVSGNRSYKPFFESDDDLLAVLLPIDRHRVLVGAGVDYEMNTLRLRREIARCSLEYFIASQPPPANSDLLPLIGEGAHLRSRDQIEGMVNELFSK